MNEFNLCITLDTDADPVFENHKNSTTFKNLEHNLENLSKKFNQIEKNLDHSIPISWFVRIDNQVKHLYGEYDWILNRYSKFWDNQLSKKNEIHWHAHIYQKIKNQWFFPENDNIFIENISEVHNYIKTHYRNFDCIRIGEACMTNNIMNFLKKTGLKGDSSCIPGRKRDDKEKFFDWSNSPNKPYFPSNTNYQIENKENKKFVEIPMNTIKTKCSYDKSYLLRYANLAFRNKVINEGLREYIQKNDTLVTISHPYEFSDKFITNNSLFYGDLNILEININNIIKICKDLNKKINFITINDIIKKFVNV